MPTFHEQPVAKPLKSNDLFEVVHDGGNVSPSVALTDFDKVEKLDPRLGVAQRLAQAEIPDRPLTWFGAAYDNYGSIVRMVIGFETGNRHSAHLFVLNDAQDHIDMHIADKPLAIVAKANALAQIYMTKE